MKLVNSISKFSTAIVVLIICACTLMMCSKDMPTKPKTTTSSIALNIKIEQLEQDVMGSLNKTATISRVTVTVTAQGMTTITKDLTGSEDTYSGEITVPQGAGRTFLVEARDTNNIVQYQGTTTKDLAQNNETIDIELKGQYPNGVTASVASVTSNSITLSWATSTDTDFDHYSITRKESSGATHSLATDKIATITSGINTTSYTDTGLESGKTYYYRVWVVDTESLAWSKAEIPATTSASLNLNRYTGAEAIRSSSYDETTHELSVAYSVENTGITNAGSFRVGWYLSDDTSLSSDDYFLTYQPINSLTAGAYINVNGSVNLWDFDCISIPSGTYYVFVYIDYLNEVSESDETDNIRYFDPPINYTCPFQLPNLTLFTGNGSETTYLYDSYSHIINLSVSVGNDGLADANSFRVGWYLSTDNSMVTTNDNVFLTDAYQTGLSSNYYNTLYSSADLDGFSCTTLPSGFYYVLIMIDYQYNINEDDETDNDYYYGQGTIYWDGCYWNKNSVPAGNSREPDTNETMSTTVKTNNINSKIQKSNDQQIIKKKSKIIMLQDSRQNE